MDERDLAAQVIVMSRVVETDRHRKAFESDPPQRWMSIYDDDLKGTETIIFPYLAETFRQLFLHQKDGSRVKESIIGISDGDPLEQNE